MKQTENHLGGVLHVDQCGYNRCIAKYEHFIERLEPLALEFNRTGLTFTQGMISRLASGKAASLIEDYTARLVDEGNKLGPALASALAASRPEQIGTFQALLNKIGGIAKRYYDCYDLPVIDGQPVLTDEFREMLKEGFTNKIRTQGGADFYGKSLEAKKLVDELYSMGGLPGVHFDLHRDGFALLSVAE